MNKFEIKRRTNITISLNQNYTYYFILKIKKYQKLVVRTKSIELYRNLGHKL